MLAHLKQEGVDAVMTIATTGLDQDEDDVLAIYFCRPEEGKIHRLYHSLPDDLVKKSESVHGVSTEKIHAEGQADDMFLTSVNRLLYNTKVAVYNPSFMATFLAKHLSQDFMRLYDLPTIYHRAFAGVTPPEEILQDALWTPNRPRGKISFAGVLSLSGIQLVDDPTSEAGALKCQALSDLYLSLGALELPRQPQTA